ncbi:acyl-CoA-like ligand-binding transcription factor [Pseudonocardia sp. TRM90224]|uniref:acyl-CoA-like ligand-binding transcription factor n=1 Tax=Pseudonocardia sp. TRM90224 TaxID=2812678 RepID=UPI001E5DF7C5|nr:TetR family transcriptional regulator [Pseudonocardia sp. TRM90224]
MTERPAPGLRERKKARTRKLIQSEALRLFREQGFAATTMEQVAAAAEVATSTVFRYFPTKEDLVLMDHLPAFVDALTSAPAELGPVQAVRLALRATVAGQDPAERAEGLERERMMLTVPELWASSLDNVTGVVATMRGILAARAGREPDDPDVRNITGAVLGVLLAVWFDAVRRPEVDLATEADRALSQLEGLRLE